MDIQDPEKSILVTRHNQLVDVLWHSTPPRDPVKYFPIEIVNLIFSFVIYHVEDLESEDPWWEQMRVPTSSEIIAGFLNGPLILASVSRNWCHIVATHPPLWSTIFIDQSENDHLERIHLFLNRSGKELLDIILVDPTSYNTHLRDVLMEHPDRFKSLTCLSPGADFVYIGSRMGPLETHAGFMNWDAETKEGDWIPYIPIPKCLRRVQLRTLRFNSRSLIQFTYFHNLKSLFINIPLEPEYVWSTQKLRFELLRHLHLDMDEFGESDSDSSWMEWVECPALVDLDLVHNEIAFNKAYAHIEACLLRFIALRNLRVHLTFRDIDKIFDISEIQNLNPYMFNGSIELTQLTFEGHHWLGSPRRPLVEAITERIFSVFVPKTHLVWPYGQFPSPIIFASLKTMRILNLTEGNRSALVAQRWLNQVEFPFLEELYLEGTEPRLLGLLRAPRLRTLHISGLIPSDLRYISNSLISIHLDLNGHNRDSWETYLPATHELQLDLSIRDLFRFKLHSSQIQSIIITVYEQGEMCPPNWTADYVAKTLGTITELNIKSRVQCRDGWDIPPGIPLFLKSFVHLKRLNLWWEDIREPGYVDQLVPHLADADFLPELEYILICQYPHWPDFFRYIQQRQSGFLTGQFRTRLKEISIRGHVHGALLEHLRESLAGKYIGLFKMPPRRKGPKEWPAKANPFSYPDMDTNGLLCCYFCHKSGLEPGCVISPSKYPARMLACERHNYKFIENQWRWNTVYPL